MGFGLSEEGRQGWLGFREERIGRGKRTDYLILVITFGATGKFCFA